MPLTQAAVRAVYDFDAPATEGLAGQLGFRVRKNAGGKVELIFENPISSRPATPGFPATGVQASITYSIQVAPALASGLPDTFADTAAAANLEAVVDVVVGPGQRNAHTVLLRPNIDAFVLVVARGGARGQMQVIGDDIWDLWRTGNTVTTRGKPALTPV
jgi:hypothetical protein